MRNFLHPKIVLKLFTFLFFLLNNQNFVYIVLNVSLKNPLINRHYLNKDKESKMLLRALLLTYVLTTNVNLFVINERKRKNG